MYDRGVHAKQGGACQARMDVAKKNNQKVFATSRFAVGLETQAKIKQRNMEEKLLSFAVAMIT